MPLSRPAEKLAGQPFVAIPVAILDACIGNPNALQLYATLCRYVNRERMAWPGQYRLAKDLGVSRRTLQRSLADLKDLGLVETTEQRDVAGTYGEVSYYVALTPKACTHRAPTVTPGRTHRAPKPSAKSVADQLDPNELDPSTELSQKEEFENVVPGTPLSATERYLREHPELRPGPIRPRKKKRSRHDDHVFCGAVFCVDPEKHAKFQTRIERAGGNPAEYDFKRMYAEFDAEFEGTDHPHLYLEKRFAGFLRDDFGDPAA